MVAHPEEGVAQVLPRGGGELDVQGTGFLVIDGVLVTCAHVVLMACPGAPLGQCEVDLRFPFAGGTEQVGRGRVIGELSSLEQDIAFLRVEGYVAASSPLPLGVKSVLGTGRPMRAYGFPGDSRLDGRWAVGEIVADTNTSGGPGQSLLQLDSNGIGRGFSGGPVIDEGTGHVVGMVAAIDGTDRQGHGQSTAWAIPVRALRALHPGLPGWSRNPYRGLQPFTAADGDQFQGREDAIEAVLRPLEQSRGLCFLFGPSGSGKSSVVQAGVIPVLQSGRATMSRWHPVLVPRPGLDLLAAAEQAGLAAARATGLAAAVRRYRQDHGLHSRVLLVVDQFEELLSTSDEKPAGSAAAELLSLHESAEDAAVLLVVRDDFYSRLAAVVPGFMDAAGSGTVNLPARLDRVSLMKIIVPPGARGVLPGDLAAEIADEVLSLDGRTRHLGSAPASILPALESSLTRLWEDGEASDEGITREAYRSRGGAAGGLVSWGDHALRGLTDEQQDAARRILLALVVPGNEELAIPAIRVRRTRQDLREMGTAHGKVPEAAADPVLDELVRHHVLTEERSPVPGEDVYYELAHDSLIQRWGQLNDWVKEGRQYSAWLERAEAARDHWENSGKQAGDLAGGTLLSDAQRWRKQHSLPARLSAFLDASRRHQRRRQRFTRIVPTVVAVILVVAGLVSYQLVASHAQNVSLQLAAESDNLMPLNPVLAAQEAMSAYQSSPTAPAQASLSAAADLPLTRILKPAQASVNSPVGAVAVSTAASTRGYIATGYATGRVTVWKPGIYQPVSVNVAGERSPVESLAFSHTGVLAAGFGDGQVYLWQAPYTGAPAGQFQPPAPPPGIQNSSQQAWSMIFGRSGTLWIAYDDDSIGEIPSPYMGTMAVSHPGELLDGNCYVAADTAIAVSASGELAVASGETTGNGSHNSDEYVYVYKPTALPRAGSDCPQPSATLTGHTGPITSVAFSPDGTMVASSSGGTGASDGSYSDSLVLVQSAADGELAASLNPDYGPVQAVTFVANGTLAMGESWGHTELWNYQDDYGQDDSTTEVGGGPGGPLSLAAGQDGTLVAGYADGTAAVWSVPIAALAPDTPQPGPGDGYLVWDAALSPDGTLLAAAQQANPDLLLWNTASRSRRAAAVRLPGNRKQVVSVVFSPGGRQVLATSEGGSAYLVSTRNPGNITVIPGRGGWVFWGAFSPNGQLIALATQGGIEVWSVTATPREIASEPGTEMRSVAFRPDGRLLASGNQEGALQTWNVSAQGALSGERAVGSFEGPVRALAFSPNGQLLAAGSYDHTVRLWNAVSLQFIRQFSPNGQAVTSLAFSPDSRILATTSDDGGVRLWNSATGDLLLLIPATMNSVNMQSVTFGTRQGILVDSGDTLPQKWKLPPFPALPETPQQRIQRILQELQ